jgi:hypothetical protein
VAVVGNTAKSIINVNYKAIVEVLIEVYFEVITRGSATFISVTALAESGTYSRRYGRRRAYVTLT